MSRFPLYTIQSFIYDLYKLSVVIPINQNWKNIYPHKKLFLSALPGPSKTFSRPYTTKPILNPSKSTTALQKKLLKALENLLCTFQNLLSTSKKLLKPLQNIPSTLKTLSEHFKIFSRPYETYLKPLTIYQCPPKTFSRPYRLCSAPFKIY